MLCCYLKCSRQSACEEKRVVCTHVPKAPSMIRQMHCCYHPARHGGHGEGAETACGDSPHGRKADRRGRVQTDSYFTQRPPTSPLKGSTLPSSITQGSKDLNLWACREHAKPRLWPTRSHDYSKVTPLYQNVKMSRPK